MNIHTLLCHTEELSPIKDNVVWYGTEVWLPLFLVYLSHGYEECSDRLVMSLLWLRVPVEMFCDGRCKIVSVTYLIVVCTIGECQSFAVDSYQC